ncbi:MAG: nucleoside triphosphate pyrophosphohydrolase [Ferruginibacter sp.]
MESTAKEFTRLVQIMDELREKCPWDKKQTIETLRHLTIEETYELTDAITDNDWKGIKEELGDLMLHIVFYAKLGAEKNEFSLQEVLHGICDKLIVRHPHIYGDVTVNNEEDVKQNWEKIKLKEGKKTILGGVPKSLPAMVKAIRLQEKSKSVGFEWEDSAQVWDKVKEELQELEEAVATGNKDRMEDEMGDVFFSLVNFARFLQVDAENALERTNKKFMNRFNGMEAAAQLENKQLHDMTLGELDILWNKMKETHI